MKENLNKTKSLYEVQLTRIINEVGFRVSKIYAEPTNALAISYAKRQIKIILESSGKFKDSFLDAPQTHIKYENMAHDTSWGVCMCAYHGKQGANVLGMLFEKAQKEIV